MSRRITSFSGVALMRSVTMSVQWPKMSRRRSFCVPSGSEPPAASLWKPYLRGSSCSERVNHTCVHMLHHGVL